MTCTSIPFALSTPDKGAGAGVEAIGISSMIFFLLQMARRTELVRRSGQSAQGGGDRSLHAIVLIAASLDVRRETARVNSRAIATYAKSRATRRQIVQKEKPPNHKTRALHTIETFGQGGLGDAKKTPNSAQQKNCTKICVCTGFPSFMTLPKNGKVIAEGRSKSK